MARIIIFFSFFLTLEAYAKPDEFLQIKKHLSSGNEEMSVVINENEAFLYLNSNRWIKNLSIGKWKLSEKKSIESLKKSLKFFAQKITEKVTYPSYHATQLIYSGAKIQENTVQYKYGLELMGQIKNMFPWKAEDVHLYKDGNILNQETQKAEVSYKCLSEQKRVICKGILGTIYSPK